MLAPLKITFHLDTPMQRSGYPIHLDALIAFAQTHSALAGMDPDDAPPGMIRELAEDLPLAKEEKDGEWAWKASALIPTGFGEKSVRMWTRKTDPDDFTRRVIDNNVLIGERTKNALTQGKPYAGTIYTDRGLQKNMFEFYPLEEIRKLEAWCVGDIDLLENLLAPESGWITHVGKRTRVGHGRVRTIQIEEDEEALKKWKLRVIPWPEAGYEPIQAGLRPPYWAVENRGQGYCPDSLF